jgi:hypothetical protein
MLVIGYFSPVPPKKDEPEGRRQRPHLRRRRRRNETRHAMRLAAAILLAALPAIAQPPSQFRSSAPITLTGSDGLNEVEIPVEAYRDARKDLADIRVFNKAGEAVPYAWAGMPPPQLAATPPIELPIFPISKVEPAGDAASAEVSVRASDGTLVSVRSKGGAAAKAQPTPKAYLLDASKATEPMRALAFSWKTAPGSEVVNIRVESSDDLRTWSGVAASPIVGLEANGRIVAQPRVEFTPQGEVLPVTWDAPSFALERARRARAARRGRQAALDHGQRRRPGQRRRVPLRPGRAAAGRVAASRSRPAQLGALAR